MRRLLDVCWRHRRHIHEFGKFCVVGIVNTTIDFSLYLVLTRGTAFFGERLVTAAVLSFLAAMVSSFSLNNFWTFRHSLQGWSRRLPKFLTVAGVGLVFNSLVLGGLLRLGVYDIFAKLAATGLVAGWNFSMQKVWTFRRLREFSHD